MFECPMCECVFEARTVCPQCGVPTTEVVGQRLAQLLLQAEQGEHLPWYAREDTDVLLDMQAGWHNRTY